MKKMIWKKSVIVILVMQLMILTCVSPIYANEKISNNTNPNKEENETKSALETVEHEGKADSIDDIGIPVEKKNTDEGNAEELVFEETISGNKNNYKNKGIKIEESEIEILAAATSMSESEFDSKANAFINDGRWSNGVYFGNNVGPKLSNFSSGGCFAYGCDFTKYMYGIDNYQNGECSSIANNIQTGDVVRENGHTFVVLKRNGNNFYTAEGNGPNGYVRIGNFYHIANNELINDEGKKCNIAGIYHFVNIISQKGCLDVNGFLDGRESGIIDSYGTFDVYLDGKKVADDVSDYYSEDCICGTSYEILDIKVRDGKNYQGIKSGSRKGVVGDKTEICLIFNTIIGDVGVTKEKQRYDNHAYIYVTQLSSWYEARYYCEDMGGHLVTINSRGEEEFLRKLTNNSPIWIGASDNENEGTWKWVTDESFTYSNWQAEQPDNYQDNDEGGENYAHLGDGSGTGWNDNVGYSLKGFVCEMEPLMDVRTKTEVLDDHTYVLVQKKTTWHEANDYCEDMGGHLVSINSEKEKNLIDRLREGAGIWIGATDEYDEGNWRWTTGEKLTYSCWNDGQPDNYTGNVENGENYAHIAEGQNQGWNDNSAYSLFYFICEIEPLQVWGGHTYIYIPRKLNWYNAEHYCENLGGHLISINSENENLFLTKMTGNDRVWIGATNEGEGGSWRWITGEDFDYSNWNNGQPDNYNNCEHYAHLVSGGTGLWNDNDGDVPYGFVCEIETDLIFPLNNEIKDETWKGHRYIYVTLPSSWYASYYYCKGMGGHLATVNSGEEEEFLRKLVNNSPIWIGGSDNENEGDWKWITGEPFSYSHWDDGQPDNFMDSENHANFQEGGNSKWNDSFGYAQYHFVCEIDSTKKTQLLTFASASVNAIYGDGNLVNTVSGSQTTVTYVVTSGTDVVDVNNSTGVVSIKKVGTAVITAKAAETDDYAEATANYTLTIGRKAVTVTADNKGKAVGAADPVFTAKVEGLIGSDTINYEVTRAAGEMVGTYTITPSGEKKQGNYNINYIPGIFTISSDTYTVTVTNDGHGTASANMASGATGTEVTLIANADSGYRFKEWQVISGGISIANNKFTIGNSNIEVKAVFEQITYTVTVVNGTGDGEYAEGKSVTIKADEPETGKRFIEWTAKGITLTDEQKKASSMIFIMPKNAVFLKADYEDIPPAIFTVTVTNDGHGTASANMASGATGTEVTLTAKADSGYRFKKWQVISGGISITNNKFTIGNSNIEVKAVFEQNSDNPHMPSVSENLLKLPPELIEDGNDSLGKTTISQNKYEDNTGQEVEIIYIGGEEVSKIVTDPESGKETVESKVWIGGLKASYTYTGSAIKPAFHVYDGTRILTEKTDYTVSWKKNKDAGKAEITVKFKGNYGDTTPETVSFEIKPAVLGVDIIAHETGVAAKNSEQKPVPLLTWMSTGKTASSKDFNITYNPSTVKDKGNYTATIKPKKEGGNYSGSTTALVTLTEKNKVLANAKVKFDQKSYAYTGKPIEPKYTLKIGDQTLTENVDYRKVSITGNTDPGMVAVIFEAISGNAAGYVGSKTATFKITGKIALKEGAPFAYSYAESVPYARGGAKPAVKVTYDGVTLKEGADYTVSYKKNNAVTGSATAEIEIKGKGRYKDTVTKKYAVTKQSLKADGISIAVADQFTTKSKLKTPKITITDIDGKKLKANTDYTIGTDYAYTGDDASGTVMVTVTGKGNYKDEVPASCRYTQSASANIAKAKANKIGDQPYTGNPVKLSANDLKDILYTGSKSSPAYLMTGRDFVAAGYSNNVKKGTAKVTVQGLGAYAGTKTMTFRIVKRKADYQGALIGGKWQKTQ